MKQKEKSTKRNSGLGQRLTQLLAQFGLTQKEAAQLCVDEDGKATKLSVFHSWCNGVNPTQYKALQSLCKALSGRGKQSICLEWLLTGEMPTPNMQSDSDLAKLFLHQDEVYDGYIHVRVSKVALRKDPK